MHFNIVRYTCSPSTARADSVMITVKHREHGALPEPVVNTAAALTQTVTGYFLACLSLFV